MRDERGVDKGVQPRTVVTFLGAEIKAEQILQGRLLVPDHFFLAVLGDVHGATSTE